MSNNRREISKKILELKIAYNNLDTFYYSNFKIVNSNNEYFLQAKPNSEYGFHYRLDKVNELITKIWFLVNQHNGGWFDTESDKLTDKENIQILLDFEKKVQKLLILYKGYKVKI
ncbi:hypothetical protein [Phocaeicola coprophilus]|uniref:hypothetical protein n=1 Tax=Phocaeicola coprophilus TaxID=387090 RepID=UPI00266C997D|nr:hypothetical protein [Phocaeicola coprophilus]